MNNQNKEPWQITAARFCVERKEFTLRGLETFLKEEPYNIPHEHVRNFFIENIQNPPGRQFNRDFRKSAEGEGGLWTAPSDLVSMVTDYDELREARESSRKAMYIAIGSLIVATLVGIAQIIVQIYYK
ncbi:MAG TPA: hypothetical protein VJH33_01045 [Candidatus Paceibacterota bacterium]